MVKVNLEKQEHRVLAGLAVATVVFLGATVAFARFFTVAHVSSDRIGPSKTVQAVVTPLPAQPVSAPLVKLEPVQAMPVPARPVPPTPPAPIVAKQEPILHTVSRSKDCLTIGAHTRLFCFVQEKQLPKETRHAGNR